MASTIKQLKTILHPAEHRSDAPILEVNSLSVRYSDNIALDRISFRLDAGERMAVVGPNGAGKSTLFKVIAGVLQQSSGDARVSGSAPQSHICIAYVPQRSQVDWSFPVRVIDVVMMGRIGKLGLLRRPGKRDWEYVRECLDVVRLSDLADRQIENLSGGQQQRMFIARALAQEAELMLMDEPLSGLDLPAQEDVFQVLDALRERDVTVMVALHDLQIAAQRFDRVMLLNRELLGLGAPTEVFTPELLMQAYGGHIHLTPGAKAMLILDDTCCEEGEGLHA